MTPSNGQIEFQPDNILPSGSFPDGFIESFVSDEDSSYDLASDFADAAVPLSLEESLQFLL